MKKQSICPICKNPKEDLLNGYCRACKDNYNRDYVLKKMIIKREQRYARLRS